MWKRLRAQLLYTWGGLHRYFGNANNLAREHERAVHYFSRAFRANPALKEARLARAVILWRELDRMDEAMADLDALVEEDPAFGPARLNRALARQQMGDYVQALADLDAYLELPPDAGYRASAGRLRAQLELLVEADESPAS